MRRILIKLLIKLFLAENREITKLSPLEEFQLYQFRRPGDVEKLLKSNLTAQTLWYWEAKGKEERQVVKGASLILKIMLDAHRQTERIIEEAGDDDVERQEILWKKYKGQKRTN